MKRKYTIIILLFFVIKSADLFSQMFDAQSKQNLQKWLKEGWQAEHQTISYDGKTLIFSALKPGDSNYELYISNKIGNDWGGATLLPKEINTGKDELWPSLSSDEQTLYFIRRFPADKTAKTEEKFVIFCSERTSQGWTEAQSLVISSGLDISPFIMDDNVTLLFASRHSFENNKITPSSYSLYFTRKVNKYDWYEPVPVVLSTDKNIGFYGPQYKNGVLTYTIQQKQKKDYIYDIQSVQLPSEYHPYSVAEIKGKLTNEAGNALNATLLVYDALTGNLLATHKSDSEYKIALPKGKNYIIDCYQNGYSHHYIEQDCRMLSNDTTIEHNIALSHELNIQVYLFDSEKNKPVTVDKVDIHRGQAEISEGVSKLILPIGQTHDIVFHKQGYASQNLHIDTNRSILLTRSELDIDLTPSKTSITIELTDEDNGEAIKGHINFQELVSGEIIEYIATNTYLPQGHQYKIEADASGYLFADTIIETGYDQEELSLSIPMMSIKKDMIMRLKNIQFEYNSCELKEESFEELDMVVRLLTLNPEMRIELSAHTDDSGSDSYNDRLSQKRGEAAKRYLIKKGIDSERIEAVGYGKRRPLVENDTEEHKLMNRRVEFKVL